MNVRAFRSKQELHEALASSVDQIVRDTLQPHIGIMAGDAHHLEPLASLTPGGIRFAAHPHDLAEILTAAGRSLADPRDLTEPLDLLIVSGPPPASEPSWRRDPRRIFVVATEEDDLQNWITRRLDADVERGWFFVLEQHWNARRPRQTREQEPEVLSR